MTTKVFVASHKSFIEENRRNKRKTPEAFQTADTLLQFMFDLNIIGFQVTKMIKDRKTNELVERTFTNWSFRQRSFANLKPKVPTGSNLRNALRRSQSAFHRFYLMSVSRLFADAREEFRSQEKLLRVALDVEVAKLDFALHGITAPIVRTEHRLKDFVSIRDNYLKHHGTPNHDVEFEKFLESCSDLIGLRVVTLYNADLELIEETISSAFGLNAEGRVFNDQDLRKGSEFGYRATHWKYEIEDDFVLRHLPNVSLTVELQIRSVFSDAWARHSHSLLYKSSDEPSDSLIREFGIASATIEGLDNKLDELFVSADENERRPYSEETARANLASALGATVGESITDGEVDTLVTLLGVDSAETSEEYEKLIADSDAAWKVYGEKDFSRLGAMTPEQKLKIALFGLNGERYESLISPHLRKRTIDFLATL